MLASSRFRSEPMGMRDRPAGLVRGASLGVALVLLVVAFGLYRQAEWATRLWALAGVRMDYVFLAGIVVSIATPISWAAWRNEPAVLGALGMTLGFGGTALGIYQLWLGLDRSDQDLVLGGIGFLVAGLASAALWRWARQLPLQDQRRLPGSVRVGLAVLTIVLVVIGIPLLFQVEDIFPWRLTPEMSTMFGMIYLSAALLFGWTAIYPRWPYGEAALTAFLGYALVLAVPYIDLLRDRDDPVAIADYYGGFSTTASSAGDAINMASLEVYLVTLAAGSLLAVWLYIRGLTRSSE